MNLTHIDKYGNARMVDVSSKKPTYRTALAEGKIHLGDRVMKALLSNKLPKGNVINTAVVAGIQAVKNTANLIPMCHPLQVQNAEISFEFENTTLKCSCSVSATAKTGFEMEALVGVTVALLTVYDMLKAIDKSMEITGIKLLKKTGGKSS